MCHISGPIPCQIALAYAHAMTDAHAHAHAPGRAGPAGPCPAPCAWAVEPSSEGPGWGRPQGPLREGPANGHRHMANGSWHGHRQM